MWPEPKLILFFAFFIWLWFRLRLNATPAPTQAPTKAPKLCCKHLTTQKNKSMGNLQNT